VKALVDLPCGRTPRFSSRAQGEALNYSVHTNRCSSDIDCVVGGSAVRIGSGECVA
jgi:hypothetical protein